MPSLEDQKLAWGEFGNICHRDGCDQPQTMFSEAELEELIKLASGVRGEALQEISANASSMPRKLPKILTPSDAVCFAATGIYDNGSQNLYLYKVSQLVLKHPKVVEAISQRPAILELLRGMVLSDLDKKAKNPKAGINSDGVDFGDGNSRRAREVADLIRNLYCQGKTV